MECPICQTDNERGLLWCKKCRWSLKYYDTVQKYYEREFKSPPVGKRKTPFQVMGLKKMSPMTQDEKVHAEERVRVQFRILLIYAWMLERGIVDPTDLVMWGGAPLQQGKSGGGKEAAHQILASLMVSSDNGTTWLYLYELPKLARCELHVQQRVKLVLGALHAGVSHLDKVYNDVDFIIEGEIRALILSYIDEIRGIFVAQEYTPKTWPRLWYAFRDDYVNLCKTLLNPQKQQQVNTLERKVDNKVLQTYIEVAEGLKYEHRSDVKQKFKDIVNLSEGENSWE